MLIITGTGEFFTSSFSDSNHYDDNILKIEKFDPNKVWTLALNDATLGFPYLKRFVFEQSAKPQRFVGSEPESSVILLTDTYYPRLEVVFGGADSVRPPLEIDAEEFIAVKSFKAKGKRISTYKIDSITELEPTRFPPEPEPEPEPELPENESASEDDERQNPKVIQGDLFDFDDSENQDLSNNTPK